MPNWEKLARQANRIIQKRGGPESVKEDAEELETIAEGKGTMSEKVKAAAKAIKEPGAPGEQHAPSSAGMEPAPSSDPAPSTDPALSTAPAPSSDPPHYEPPGPAA